MKVVSTAIPELLIIEPKVFGDDRGFFFESFNRRRFAEHVVRVPISHLVVRACALQRITDIAGRVNEIPLS